MPKIGVGFKILHQNGELSPRVANYHVVLLKIANDVRHGAKASHLQAEAVRNSRTRLQVDGPRKGEKGKQSVASFMGDVMDAQFKQAVKEVQEKGHLPGLRITKTATGEGAAAEKRGPDLILDLGDERVAWDITSEAEVAHHYDRDVRGKEESWNAYIVFPY